MRWLNSFNAAQDFSEQHGVGTIWVADREADILDVYAARWQQHTHLVVRDQHNRTLANSSSKLYSLLKQQPNAGTYEIEIIHPQTLKKRSAKLAVRFCPVEVKVASNAKHKTKLGHPAMNAIEVCEVDAPDTVDKPIRWVLLTTLPVTSFEQALRVVRIYIKRWLVERFHYLLKTDGAQVEQLQLEQTRSLQNVITTYSISIIQIIKIRYLSENQLYMSVFDAGIEPLKCKILYAYAQKNVKKDLVFDADNPPTVYEYCQVLGMIGGFFPRKSQPLPGLKILTRASEKFNHILGAFDVFMAKNFDS
ncbi:MAG: IS4 family transposase [Bacteroidota bacterium]